MHRAAQMGARIVWMPTMDGREFQKIKDPHQDLSPYLTVLTSTGELTAEASAVLDLVKEHNLVLSTGYLAAYESIPLLEEAAARGIRKMVVTHADNCNNEFTLEEQKHCAQLGAYIEHSYFMAFYNRTPLETMAGQIAEVGARQIILDTDFSQPASPYPDEGMNPFVSELHGLGVSQDDLRVMTVHNPGKLLG